VNAEVFVFTIDPFAPVGLRCRPTRRTGRGPLFNLRFSVALWLNRSPRALCSLRVAQLNLNGS